MDYFSFLILFRNLGHFTSISPGLKNMNLQYMKGSDGWLLHALNSIPPLCVWVCRHHAKWWTLSCMVSQPLPRPWGGVGFDPSSQEVVLGKISKLMETYVQIFSCFLSIKCLLLSVFSGPKVLFVCEMSAFYAKNVLFFPWKGPFFKCFFLPKSTTIPII